MARDISGSSNLFLDDKNNLDIYDNRTADFKGSEGSSVLGDGNTVRTSNYTVATDHDAMREAGSISKYAVEQAARVASDLGTRSLSVAGDFARLSDGMVRAVSDDLVSVSRDVVSSSERSKRDAFSFARDVSRDAIREQAATSREAMDAVGYATSEAMDGVREAVRQSALFAGDALEKVNAATENALDFAANSTRSEAGLAQETFVKWAFGGLALVAVAFAFRGK